MSPPEQPEFIEFEPSAPAVELPEEMNDEPAAEAPIVIDGEID